DHDEDDELIEAAIAAAVGHLDGHSGILGRALMPQEWCEYASFWPASRAIELRLAPVLEIAEVRSRDGDGVETVLDESAYRLLVPTSSRPILLFGVNVALPALASAPDALSVTYRAGYEDAEGNPAIPAALISAIKLMIGDLYRYPETVAQGAVSAVPMSTTVDRLVSPYRRYQI
ncbi:MAG: hypothetical protein EOP23_23745, partial [Hyphomicrobiales bacterium]